jgi:hypothetical protein
MTEAFGWSARYALSSRRSAIDHDSQNMVNLWFYL